MIQKRNAVTAMLESRKSRTSTQGVYHCRPVVAVGRAVIRSNRVMITERRDMPLVHPVKTMHVSKKK